MILKRFTYINLLISFITAIILWSLHFALYYFFCETLFIPRYVEFIPLYVIMISFISTILRYVLTKIIEKILIQKEIINKKIIKSSLHIYIIKIMFINIIVYSILFYIIANLESISYSMNLIFFIIYIIFTYMSELTDCEFLIGGEEKYMNPRFLYDKSKSYIHAMDIRRLLNPTPSSPTPRSGSDSPPRAEPISHPDTATVGASSAEGTQNTSTVTQSDPSSSGPRILEAHRPVYVEGIAQWQSVHLHVKRVLDASRLRGSTTTDRDWTSHNFGTLSNPNPFFINIPSNELPEGVSIVENKFVFSNNLQDKEYIGSLLTCTDLDRRYPVYTKNWSKNFARDTTMIYRFHEKDINNLSHFRKANYKSIAVKGRNSTVTSARDRAAFNSDSAKFKRKF